METLLESCSSDVVSGLSLNCMLKDFTFSPSDISSGLWLAIVWSSWTEVCTAVMVVVVVCTWMVVNCVVVPGDWVVGLCFFVFIGGCFSPHTDAFYKMASTNNGGS